MRAFKARWFEDAEFNCPCGRPECEAPKHPHRLLAMYLDRMREMYGEAITVTSGNRCDVHNRLVGGVSGSEHVNPDGCLGADLACTTSAQRAKMLDAARVSGFSRVGVYRRHLHVGIGDMLDAAAYPSPVVWVG